MKRVDKSGGHRALTFSSQVQKRGQMKISFGMIFSIIMIVFFIAFAIYAIQKFLGVQSFANTQQFTDNLQKDVDAAFAAAQASQPETYSLSTSVEEICFTNIGPENLLLKDKSGIPKQSVNINHLNITAMIPSGQSEKCFNNVNGKMNLVIEKNFDENLVRITS